MFHSLPRMSVEHLPLIVAALTFLLAGLVKGVIGLGLPTVSMGLFSLVMAPAKAASLLIVPSFVTNVWQLAAGPNFGRLARRLWPMLAGVVAGTLAGTGLLTGSSAHLPVVGSRMRGEMSPAYAEEGPMKRLGAAFTAVGAFAAGVIVVSPSLGAAETAPPMGGGYTNVIPIPVDDPKTKTIAGALFKPSGSGPFPALVYMSGCAGLDIPPETRLEKALIDHQLARGVAILIVDPFTPRGKSGMAHEGLCERISDSDLSEKEWALNATRGGNDIVAAVKVLRSMTDIDPARIFLQGYSIGAASSLSAARLKKCGDARGQDRWSHRVLPVLQGHGLFDANSHSYWREG